MGYVIIYGDSRMIEAKSISKFFSVINEKGIAEGLTACLNISLNIPDGKIVSFLGPSGCGKSTFLEILGGLAGPHRRNHSHRRQTGA